MGIPYIRTIYGVPAKRGMRVRPKVGKFMAGRPGRILHADSSGARLVVRDDSTDRRQAWWGIFHPHDLDYIAPSAQGGPNG